MINRRDFLKTTALAGGALALGIRPRRMRILILGGTGFIGPHLVRRAVDRGHDVTIFNRGQSEPGLFQDRFRQVHTLVGDRNDDLASLEGGSWDVVIDNSGYTPEQVRATARLLRDHAGQYIFTSTRAVYRDYTVHMDEGAPLGPDLPEEEWSGYGPMKVLAEREVQEAFGGRTTIVRPPILTGPLDGTDRFTYWYERIDRGGQVLAPGDPTDPVQYLDVRDLADFFVHLAEEGTPGIFNTVAPAAPLSSMGFLKGVRAITSSPVHLTWVPWDGVGDELPGWQPPEGRWLNYGRMDNRRAIAAGMTFRPLAVTAADTLEWWKGTGADRPRAGISPEREAEILAAAR